MTYKQQIDYSAEQEGKALRRQGRSEFKRHTREAKNYNADKFERLFKN